MNFDLGCSNKIIRKSMTNILHTAIDHDAYGGGGNWCVSPTIEVSNLIVGLFSAQKSRYLIWSLPCFIETIDEMAVVS